ncbi:MAG TPA: signal recognition particle protein Srp54 [Thermoplasmataceae archaeon]|nr:signal recognition particle protein Srp54 [Thermoplasmatales archaeon AK]HLH85572.1 signal recognition particle protein Srp54 [Thermoplasmataceae archaeon]
MVLEALSSQLRETLRKLSHSSYVSKEVLAEVSKDIQRALLKADVNVKLVLELTSRVEKRATEEKPPAGMTEQDHIVRIIYEELLSILGEDSKIQLRPQTIMLVGLYGQGKTTSAGKLAKFFHKKGLSCGLIAADIHRPAAYDQLEQIARQVNAQFYGERDQKNSVKIVKNGLEKLKEIQVKIIDTSGRDSLNQDLIDEIKQIKAAVSPDEVLYVIDATIGQQAGPQAKTIHEAVGITGVIVTKMDGTGKGGGALSAVSQIHAPVYFIGTGEHLDDLEVFNSKKFLSRLLGLGDLETLLEAVKETNITEQEAEESMNKLMSGKFNLKDMYELWEKFAQPGIIRKMFDALPLGRIPGGAKIGEADIESAQNKLATYRVILDSMTFYELENPEEINAKRIARIARGSGRSEQDVRNLLREFKAMKNNIKMLKGNRGFKKMLRNQIRGGNFSLENIQDSIGGT